MPFVPSPQMLPPPRVRELSDRKARLALRHLASRVGTRGRIRTAALAVMVTINRSLA